MKIDNKQAPDLEKKVLDLTVKLAQVNAKVRWNDIERKKAEASLEKTRTILHAILSASDEGILAITDERQIISYNQRFVDIWEIPVSSLESGDDETVINFVLGQLTEPASFQLGLDVIDDQEITENLNELYLKDGRIIHVRSYPQLIDERETGRVWCFRDITESHRRYHDLKKAYEELKKRLTQTSENGKRLNDQPNKAVFGHGVMETNINSSEKIFDAIDNGIAIYDHSKQCRYANPAMAAMFGYASVRDLLGETWEIFYSREAAAKIRDEMFAALMEKGNSRGTAIGKHCNGTPVPHNLSLKMFKNGEIAWICRNISNKAPVADLTGDTGESTLKLLNDLSLLAYVLDKDGRIVSANAAGSKALGYDVGELNNTSFLKIIHEENHQGIRKLISASLKNPAKQQQMVVQFVRKDGQDFWVEVFAQGVTGVAHTSGVMIVCKDITEQESLKATLRELGERHRTLTEKVPSGISITNIRLEFIYCNDALSKMLGYSRDELLSFRPIDLFRSQDRVNTITQLHGVLNGDSEHSGEYEILTRDGATIPVDISSRRIYYDGEPALLSVFRDLSERRRAEAAIRQSEKKYRELFEIAQEGILVVDSKGSIQLVNPHIVKMLNCSQEEILEKPLLSFIDISQQKRAEAFLNSASAREKDSGDFELIRKGGLPLFVNMQVSALEEEGQLLQQIILVDITERKKAQEVLKKHKDSLEEAVRRRTKILHRTNTKLQEEIRERERTEVDLKRSREELRHLSAHLESAREKERKWIAREIHDDLGQALSALKMDVTWLENNFTRDNLGLLDKTRSMSTLIGSTIDKVRQISKALRPSTLDNLGFTDTIIQESKEFEKRSGIRCQLTIEDENISLGEDTAIALFRVFQESLTNVFRHSNATRVKIYLKKDAQNVYLLIEDNGIGVTNAQLHAPTAFGLIGIRERINFLNGDVSIKGVSGKGTIVNVRVPQKETQEGKQS